MAARKEWTCYACGDTMNKKSKSKHLDSATHARALENELNNQQDHQPEPQAQYYQQPQQQPYYYYYQQQQEEQPYDYYYQEQHDPTPILQPQIYQQDDYNYMFADDDVYYLSQDEYDDNYGLSQEDIAGIFAGEEYDNDENRYGIPQDIIDEIQA